MRSLDRCGVRLGQSGQAAPHAKTGVEPHGIESARPVWVREVCRWVWRVWGSGGAGDLFPDPRRGGGAGDPPPKLGQFRCACGRSGDGDRRLSRRLSRRIVRRREAGSQLEVALLVVGRLVRLVVEQPLACTESA